MELKPSSLKPSVITRSSLAGQITAILRQEVLTNFKPGQSLPPIMEMAKGFGVSYQTVREGLIVLEAEGLVDRRSGSGTFVCDHGQGRPAKHIAVWCERDIFDPHASYFYRYVPRQLVRFFRAQGLEAKLYVGEVSHAEPQRTELTCTEFAHAVEQRQVCGVVAFDEPMGSGWLEPLRQQNTPVVRWRETDEHSNSPCLPSNKSLKGRMGAEYLLSHGRRNLALMQWLEPQLAQTPVDNPVMEGFRAAMAAAGVELNLKWIRSDLPPGAPGAGWEEFREIWAGSEEKPDGLLVCDDVLFLGAALAILQLGIRVPEDLLVVTHYNKGSGLIIPFPVAKLVVDLDGYVQTMGRKLVQLMRGVPAESHAATIELLEAVPIGDSWRKRPVPTLREISASVPQETGDGAQTTGGSVARLRPQSEASEPSALGRRDAAGMVRAVPIEIGKTAGRRPRKAQQV